MRLYRRSLTQITFCRKSSIFIVKLSSWMPETFFDTCVNWSCVTRCGYRTTSSTLFTVYIIGRREHATPESKNSQVSRGCRNLSGYVSFDGSWRDVRGWLETFQLPYVCTVNSDKAMSMDRTVPCQKTNCAKYTQNILTLALYGNIYCIFSPIFVQKYYWSLVSAWFCSFSWCWAHSPATRSNFPSKAPPETKKSSEAVHEEKRKIFLRSISPFP